MTLISREDAIEAICGVVINEFDVCPTCGYDVAEKALLPLPSAESVQGEWIVTEHCSNEYGFRKWLEIECPFCGERPTYENLDNMNYCPNCGAKMDKE